MLPIRLDQICDLKRGTAISRKSVLTGQVPVVAGGREPAYYHNVSNRDANTITISGSGAYAGYVNYFTTPIFASDCFTIKPKNEKEVCSKYILFWLKSQQDYIYSLQSGAGQPHVYPKDLAGLIIHTPSMQEQHHIITVLEEIDDLRQKQRKALELSRQMIPALFYEMFGDPLSNAKKISKDFLKNCTLSIKSGFACGKSSRDASGNILHLRPMNITSSGRLSLLDTKFISIEALPDAESFSIKKDDVLFNNTNSKELVGKSSYVSQDLENTAFSNHITRIRTNQTLDPFFLASQLQTIQERGFFFSVCNKWIGQAGINNQNLLDLSILVPPIELQRTFAQKAQECLSLFEHQEYSLQQLDALFEATLHQFFSHNA